MTPLHLAAEIGRIKMLHYFIEEGADINIQDHKGVIIHNSVARIPDWIWASLISWQVLYPFSVFQLSNNQNSRLQTSKHFAVDICILVYEKFKSTIRNTIYIHSGSQLQKLTYVKICQFWITVAMYQCPQLKLLFILNQCTPLHVAASKGHDYTVKYLVKKGADIGIKDKAGVRKTILLNYGRWS